ncbi:unnamed protein product [Caenorhabditis bovis]|uniref:Uncharacterized protein n=1 Tax=Caenorhabditis bovis TaxID=2654633 RepID=A0A8S1FFA9_9PELO|nr:unnamed protein product [Caenorhabditis bovis]
MCLFSSTYSANNDMEMVFVQTFFRHGDRAALYDHFPISVEEWEEAAGGIGELSPIYVRSTNVNRTIMSGNSVFSGMYTTAQSQNDGIISMIPVHVEDEPCGVTEKCVCKRKTEIETLRRNSTVFLKWFGNPQNIGFGMNISKWYNVSIEDTVLVPDSLTCQRIHFNDTLYAKAPWYNEEFYRASQEWYKPQKAQHAGVYGSEEPPIVNGIDVQAELRRLQIPMLAEVYDRAMMKFQCYRNPTNCSESVNNLKFFAYSSHDRTMFILMGLLGVEELVDTEVGWPDYTATLVFENFVKNGTDDNYFRLLYRAHPFETTFQVVTQKIKDCDNQEYCSMEVLRNITDTYKTDMDIDTMCNTPIQKSGNSQRNLLFLANTLIVSFAKHFV